MDTNKDEETAACEGCSAILIVGSVPTDLFIPLPGINVWDRHPTATTTPARPLNSSNKQLKRPYAKNLTICLNCFNGHVTGRRSIPFDVLGISIVKAPYTNTEKYLKIEGPTKVVNLLSDDYKTLRNSEDMVTESRIKRKDHNSTSTAHAEYIKPTRKRKQIINYDEDNDDEDFEDEIIERVIPERESQLSVIDLGAPTTVNYLTIGNDMLGAMEMTDD